MWLVMPRGPTLDLLLLPQSLSSHIEGNHPVVHLLRHRYTMLLDWQRLAPLDLTTYPPVVQLHPKLLSPQLVVVQTLRENILFLFLFLLLLILALTLLGLDPQQFIPHRLV